MQHREGWRDPLVVAPCGGRKACFVLAVSLGVSLALVSYDPERDDLEGKCPG